MPLWVTTSAIARPAYYDRNARAIMFSFAGVIGPSPVVVQATYTPPVAYAAFLEVGTVSIIRNVAAAAPIYAQVLITTAFAGGGGGTLGQWTNNSNVLYVYHEEMIPTYGYVKYGDTVQICTFNPELSGSFAMNAAVKGTQFLF